VASSGGTQPVTPRPAVPGTPGGPAGIPGPVGPGGGNGDGSGPAGGAPGSTCGCELASARQFLLRLGQRVSSGPVWRSSLPEVSPA
jgi:hypothetical protein